MKITVVKKPSYCPLKSRKIQFSHIISTARNLTTLHER